MSQTHILIIDDEPMVRAALEALLAGEDYTLHFAENGIVGLSRAIELLPDIIILDVIMPYIDGFEVCRRMRETPSLADVPIIMLTSLEDRTLRLTGLQAGADDFLNKPLDRLELIIRLRTIARLNRYRRLIEQRDALAHLHQELMLAYDKTIEGWSKALDLRDKETEGHTQRVTDKTLQFARLAGVEENQLEHVQRGALLHDVGKLGIPDSILLKPGPLSPQEWDVMKQHPQYAYDWLISIEYLRPALDIPYCHHEKWDGSGYPRGLKGEEIPLTARLFAIVDVWDALNSNRPYRPAMGTDEVKAYILLQANHHFDPHLVSLFLDSNIGQESGGSAA